jgi:hypothetical protein
VLAHGKAPEEQAPFGDNLSDTRKAIPAAPTSLPRVYASCRIRLASFLYGFRRLTWREEAGIKPKAGQAPGDLLLALALHDISGLPISSREEATQVIQKILLRCAGESGSYIAGISPRIGISVQGGCMKLSITPPTTSG